VARYGQLPDVPARVHALAKGLAPPSLTPLDRARAIEAHLRDLRYELRVPPPPADRDGVDFFLFDSGVGYCDYFATAMAVLLRSAGVPARVASGYAVGEQDTVTGAWLVRDLNAHSWVEVFFPRYGWVEFEPSPSRPTIAPGARAAVDSGGLPASLATPTPNPAFPLLAEHARRPETLTLRSQGERGIPWVVVGGAVALVAIGLLGRAAWWWGIDRLPVDERGYARLAQLGWLLGRGARPEQTPHEVAEMVAGRLPAAPDAARLAAAFARSRFADAASRTPPAQHEGLEAAWRRVRADLLRGLFRPTRR
jgi:hypothetical protein